MAKTAPATPPRSPRRLWRWLGRVALLLLLIGVLWAGYLWWSLSAIATSGQRELAEILAELDATDPRWHWEDIEADRAAVPDDQNSLRVIAGFAKQQEGDWSPSSQENLDYALKHGLNHRLHPLLVREMRTEWTKNAQSIARVASLKDYPRGRSDVQLQANVFSTRLPHLSDCRIAAWLLTLDSELRLEAGQASSTLEQFDAAFNLGRALQDEPLLIGQITRLAMRLQALKSIERRLALSQPEEPFLAALQARVEAETETGPSDIGLRSERAEMHKQFENIKRGDPAPPDFLANVRDPGSKPTFWSWAFDSLYTSKLDEDHAAYLRWTTRMLAAVRLPLREQTPAIAQCESDADAFVASAKGQQRWLITQRYLPRLAAVSGVVVRDRSLFLCARVALAAERYRRANNTWPDALGDLVPNYLPEVPRDPNTGEPLVLEVRDDGIDIVARSAEPQRFRLWHANFRALPALQLFEDRTAPKFFQE
jgi:hypothetical protein